MGLLQRPAKLEASADRPAMVPRAEAMTGIPEKTTIDHHRKGDRRSIGSRSPRPAPGDRSLAPSHARFPPIVRQGMQNGGTSGTGRPGGSCVAGCGVLALRKLECYSPAEVAMASAMASTRRAFSTCRFSIIRPLTVTTPLPSR